MERSDRRLNIALGIGLAGFALVPWYRIESGFYGLGWLGKFPSGSAEAPGLVQIASHGRWSLAIIALLFVLGLAARASRVSPLRANLLIGAGAAGLVFLALPGLAIGFPGWCRAITRSLFGPLPDGPPSQGGGARLASPFSAR